VTSLPVSKANVADIAAAGRSRWKIENETFNVMKNHGYELEHNFGHGKKFLAMTLAALNLLALAWHSALDIVEPPWQAARQAAAKRSTYPDLDELCGLPLLVGPPQSPDHLHDSPGTAPDPENRIEPRPNLLLELLSHCAST
jgi:hypothetical protein